MQNTTFLWLIFALKAKIGLPTVIDMQNMSNLSLDLEVGSEAKIDVSDLFFFSFFGLHLLSGTKTVPILGEDLFLFDFHLQNSPPIANFWLRGWPKVVGGTETD